MKNPNKKWANDCNKHHTKEYIQISEMPIKTTMRSFYRLIKMVKIRTMSNVGEDIEKQEFSLIAGENANATATSEVWQLLMY